jgi:hypothetical protein
MPRGFVCAFESMRYAWRVDRLRHVEASVRFISAEPLLTVASPASRRLSRGWRVVFFLKQWGGARPTSGGRELDDRQWSEYPRDVVYPSAKCTVTPPCNADTVSNPSVLSTAPRRGHATSARFLNIEFSTGAGEKEPGEPSPPQVIRGDTGPCRPARPVLRHTGYAAQAASSS